MIYKAPTGYDDVDDIFAHPDQFLHNVGVDNVIFGYHDKELKVLLQKPIVLKKWTITGGYILKSETIEAAAKRIANARTGLKDLYFQQFRAFGTPSRTKDRGFSPKLMSEATGIDIPEDHWIFDYFVSIGFYTLTEFSRVTIQKSSFEEACQWWPVSELPPMMFDHKTIINEALNALRLHIACYPIGFELLEEKFTLPEIRGLYESILGRTLDDRNFSKKLLATGIVIKLKETRRIGPHRSPFLYKFDKARYEQCLESGVQLIF